MGNRPLDVGSLVMVTYRDGSSHRAQVTNMVQPHFVIRYVNADGELVEGPKAGIRLFWIIALTSVAKDADDKPLATVEPDWPETRSMFEKEARHAAE
jgi:hypothetical protein